MLFLNAATVAGQSGVTVGSITVGRGVGVLVAVLVAVMVAVWVAVGVTVLVSVGQAVAVGGSSSSFGLRVGRTVAMGTASIGASSGPVLPISGRPTGIVASGESSCPCAPGDVSNHVCK